MKKTYLIKYCLISILTLFFASCSNDDDNNNNIDYGLSTGNFLPLAVNNSWKYTVENQSDSYTTKIISAIQFSGSTYYEFIGDGALDIGFDVTIKQFFGKKGATYLLKADESKIDFNGIIAKLESYEIPILRDDYEINKKWTGTLTPKFTFTGNGQSGTLPFKVDYKGENYYKGEITQNGIVYPNVIKTKVNITINANNQISTASEEYWFAENIGIIKSISISDQINRTTIIESFNLF
ncbi:hypothetical protein [Flavobacterium luteum]|uniref:Uncharacterized protein n=1 Tax=Flavobacterium luteum TaxID=2026654 RepID=A0A7J5AI85_9FLAO|nr:hypothetical protein [Flavobacterium luteum]KAB1157118.1 hypothetical protein F6464_07175 [Flavobacterium luteum]